MPLISEGSIVVATLSGTGISETLSGGIQGQIVQIPVIPDGDWVISGTQTITLQSIDGMQTLNGNLVIEDNAVLHLTNLDLLLTAGKSITLTDNGQIIAENSSIIADIILVNDSSLISGNDASKPLQINSAVEWNCLVTTSTINILFLKH